MLWRKRRWRRLLNLIDRLPPWSQYGEAVTNDERVADMVARGEIKDAPAAKPSIAEWNPTVDAINTAIDRLGDVVQVIAATAGGKVSIPPRPRPETAIDRARERARHEQRESLIGRLLAPDGARERRADPDEGESAERQPHAVGEAGVVPCGDQAADGP